MLLEILINVLTSKLFIADVIIGIICIEYALYKCKPLIKVDEVREQKYSAFKRNDVKYWRRPYLYLASPLVFLRFGSCVLIIILSYLLTRLVNFNVREGQMPSDLQIRISRWQHKFGMRTIGFISGIYFFRHKKLDVDYKKYLGPEWKPTNRIPSTIVSNHCVWLDIMMLWQVKDYPIFAAKSPVKNFPFIGYIASYPGFDTIFLNRAGSKEERLELVKVMGEHQALHQKNQDRSLVMFPEGCTTNNTELIQFRRGAFYYLHSIQPFTLRYWSPFFQPPHDIMPLIPHAILLLCQPFQFLEIQELPVFEPNDYFFDHHSQSGEEKWQTYMRVIRQLMADALGFKQSNLKLEDKFDYKMQLWPSKGEKAKFE